MALTKEEYSEFCKLVHQSNRRFEKENLTGYKKTAPSDLDWRSVFYDMLPTHTLSDSPSGEN